MEEDVYIGAGKHVYVFFSLIMLDATFLILLSLCFINSDIIRELASFGGIQLSVDVDSPHPTLKRARESGDDGNLERMASSHAHPHPEPTTLRTQFSPSRSESTHVNSDSSSSPTISTPTFSSPPSSIPPGFEAMNYQQTAAMLGAKGGEVPSFLLNASSNPNSAYSSNTARTNGGGYPTLSGPAGTGMGMMSSIPMIASPTHSGAGSGASPDYIPGGTGDNASILWDESALAAFLRQPFVPMTAEQVEQDRQSMIDTAIAAGYPEAANVGAVGSMGSFNQAVLGDNSGWPPPSMGATVNASQLQNDSGAPPYQSCPQDASMMMGADPHLGLWSFAPPTFE